MTDGKKALFDSSTTSNRSNADGKDSLFSASDRRGITVECSRCEATNQSELLDTLARISWFSIWIPTKKYSRWMLCPSCHERAWVKIRWFD